MLLPIRTDYRLSRLPVANYVIIALNLLIFFMGYNDASPKGQAAILPWLLDPYSPNILQFFTAIFLHANWMHLLGNMLFLFVFGNAINDKLGNFGYVVFYLAGGVLSGAGYLLLAGNAPVLGASGAIAAVCGAFLVLLPRTKVTLIFFFIFITPLYVPSLYAIAFQFLFDLVMTLNGFAGPASNGVAYAAHSTGYIFGIAVSMLLLWLGLIKRDDFDFLHMLQQYHRRQQLRQAVAVGYDPFGKAPPVKLRPGTKTPPLPKTDDEEFLLRSQITAAVSSRDLPAAAGLYMRLLEHNKNAVLSRQVQLDVANQLMASQFYLPAARAYELFIKHYHDYEYIGDIYLMLGVLYCRYLKDAAQAVPALEAAVDKLTDEKKLEMARGCLRECR